MVSSSLRRKYLAERGRGYPARVAFEIARAAEREPRYPFLADMDYGRLAIGTVGSLSVRVGILSDGESSLGEDDVTGWFTDTYEDGCVKNTVSGNNAGGFKYYRPSNDTLQNSLRNLRAAGMSKSAALDAYRAQVDLEMFQDAEREYCAVEVSVYMDGIGLANTSLWGIDVIPGYDPMPYFIEVAENLIDEALDQAKAEIPKEIERLERLVATLRGEISE